MKTILQKIASCSLASILVFLPLVAFGQATNLIVCDGVINECNYASLITLGINIMNYLIVIAVPLAAISFVVAGFKLITSAGNESGLNDAKKIFRNTAIGLVIVLAAWLIIKTILLALLGDPSYSLLG